MLFPMINNCSAGIILNSSLVTLFEESLLVTDPVFSKEDAYVLDRKHAYERNLQKGLQITELAKKYQITDQQELGMLEK